MLLTFTLTIVIGAASTFITVSMTLRKPIEDQLREF
jgi:integral membrane sensor domain MASE1